MAAPVETPIGTVTAEHFRPGHVRHQVFLGPKFIYAMFNPRDELHPVTLAFMSFLRDGELPYRRLVLDDHVVDEAATRLKKQASTRNAISFLETIEESTLYQYETVSEHTFEDARSTFVEWDDLDASFTDFAVRAHMQDLDIDHILTFDRHDDAFDVTTLPYGNRT